MNHGKPVAGNSLKLTHWDKALLLFGSMRSACNRNGQVSSATAAPVTHQALHRARAIGVAISSRLRPHLLKYALCVFDPTPRLSQKHREADQERRVLRSGFAGKDVVLFGAVQFLSDLFEEKGIFTVNTGRKRPE
jgi:hypothetical protein